MPRTLLCVDDHVQELELRKYLFEQRGYTVHTATEGFPALEIAERTPLDLVMLDYHMDGMDGEAIAKVLKARHPALRILLLSGYDVPERLHVLVDRVVAKADPLEDLLRIVDEMAAPAAAR